MQTNGKELKSFGVKAMKFKFKQGKKVITMTKEQMLGLDFIVECEKITNEKIIPYTKIMESMKKDFNKKIEKSVFKTKEKFENFFVSVIIKYLIKVYQTQGTRMVYVNEETIEPMLNIVFGNMLDKNKELSGTKEFVEVRTLMTYAWSADSDFRFGVIKKLRDNLYETKMNGKSSIYELIVTI